MSTTQSYPGQSFQNTLTALKGWYEEGALDANCRIGSNVNLNSTGAVVHSGLVVHVVSVIAQADPYGGVISGPGQALVVEMGCGVAMGPPLFLWSGNNEPDISNPGVPTGTPVYGDSTYGPPDQVSVFPRTGGESIPALVGLGNFEVESTGYDTAQTYTPGNGLRTVTSNTNANGGKVTNQGASSAAFTNSTALVVPGANAATTDTIVGWVSRGVYINANRKSALAFWTDYLPGTR